MVYKEECPICGRLDALLTDANGNRMCPICYSLYGKTKPNTYPVPEPYPYPYPWYPPYKITWWKTDQSTSSIASNCKFIL